MIGEAAISRLNFDATSSKFFARNPLAHTAHLRTMFEQRTAALLAVAQTHWIELVSILILCTLLCAGLYYLRTSIPITKNLSNTTDSISIKDCGVQQKALVNVGAGHPLDSAGLNHLLVTDIDDASPHVLEFRNCTRECADLPLSGHKRPTVHQSITVTQRVTADGPEMIAAGPWEPRRSGRVRRATKRFEESWCCGRLQNLGLALGVEAGDRSVTW